VDERRRSSLLIAAGAALLLAGGIGAAVLELTGGGATTLARVEANSVGVIDPKANRITAQIPVGAAPSRIALVHDSAWVVNSEDATLSRIDVGKRVVRRTISIPGKPSGVTADERGAWVVYRPAGSGTQAGGGNAEIAFVDGRYDAVKQTSHLHQLFDYEDAISLGDGSLWSVDAEVVTRLDPESGRILAEIRVGPTPLGGGITAVGGIASGEGAVWGIGSAGIVRIDPKTNRVVATIPISQGVAANGPSPTAVAVGEDAVWVASRFVGFDTITLHSNRKVRRGIVSRIDPATNSIVATIPVGLDPFAIAVGEGAVWVANRTSFSVSRIDPQTNGVAATIGVGNRPQGIAAGGGAVWVSVG
jgi:YVTN family beta-propeller protein